MIEHRFDAPVEVVWRMWTDPEHFKAWYGPDGSAIPVAEMDVRVGGAAARVHGDANPGRADADVVRR